jgi:signal peptidase II
VLGLDRLTKWIVETRVSFTESHNVIPGVFDIVHSANRGVTFGLFSDTGSSWRTVLVLLLPLAAVAFLIRVLWRAGNLDRLSRIGFALILGGAAGNLFDRIVYGRVTDFLDFYIGEYHWYTFNIADAAVVGGCGLLLLEMLRPKRQTANVP